MKIFFFANLNFKEGFFSQTRRIKMSKISSLFTTILGVLGCSAAVALQPTVRAGSLSLNSAVKPTAGNVTSTVATQSTATSDASRGSALSKFSPAVVPVSRTNDNNNQNVNSAVLDELRQEIAELTTAQNSLRDNQLSRSDVEDTVEDTVKGLNLTTTNTDLKNTISDLQSSNQSLQRSIDSLTNRTENLEDTENGAVVNILKVRGLINSNNTVPFALKTEIEPTALAQKIVTDASATATLADKIQPKDTDIRDIITDELTEVGVLKNGALDVEKKGEVQVTEATVTNALRDSSNFKQMVSDEIATKGYVTDTALNDRDFVTNDALNNKKFLSTDSVAFSKLATKDEIAPAAIAASIADSESAKQVLSGKIGPDESSVKGLITGELQRLQIVDGANTLKVATTAQVDPVSIATSIADNEAAKAKLSGKIGPDESSVKGLIFDELKKRDIVDASDNLKLATANDVSVESLTDKLDNVFAGKNEVPTVDEETVSAALANSTTLDNTIIRNLKNKHLLKDSGDLNVATNDSVSTLSSRVAVLDGGINDDGSLLNIIAKDETLKELLRGKDGKDGTSYKLKGSVETYENLVKNNVTQIPDIVEGDGYFTQDTGKLYVYNCDSSGKNCKFPAEKDGIELKGEKGDPGDPGVSAETTWHSYCTTDNNLNNIIKPLYGTSKTCDNFTEEEYIALMDGSKAYCMLVAKNAKENSNYLVATKGIGKTLEDIFGSGTVSNLKNNGLSASVSINGQSEKFVFACAKKYDEIMNPKSAWYSYCSEGTNLTSIIQPLYGTSTVKTCDDFTQEQYNAIMGGPKAYCLMVAKNVDSSTLNVKNNLKRLFGDTIVSTLSSQKVATKVTLNNQTISFVDACAQKYEEIMAGKSGEGYTYRGTIDNYNELSGKSCDAEHEGDAWYNLEVGDALLYICACNDEKNSCSFPAKGRGVNFKGEPGENGKPASQIYCEAHAVNYPDDVTNLTLIQKLYPNKGISSCDPSVFTQDLYAAIIGGANAYCTSLNATFNTGVSLNDGVGLKLAKIYATKKSVSLSSAKDALRTLQTKDAKQRMNDSDFSILDECIANYNSIMSGDDAEKPEVTYCKAQAEHYKDGTLNRDLARKLFPNDTISDDCSDFTAEMYAKMVGGADAFCANLTATFDKVSLDDGIGLKMAKLYMKSNTDVKDLSAAKSALTANLVTGKSAADRLNSSTTKIFGGKSLLDACIENYNSIMSGDDAETTWHAYCVAQNDKDTSKTNLEVIIKPLYGNAKTCDNFTSDEYNAIMGGAKAYCLSLAQNATTMDLTSGIGEKLSKTFGAATMTTFKETTSLKDRMTLKTFTGKTAANKDFVSACEERYNEIMSGADGESAWHAYCVATNEKDNTQTNLTAIIQPLYGNNKTCDNFTSDEYNALLNGAKAYCVLVAQQLQSQTLEDFNATDIGKRLTKTLGTTAISDLKTTGLSATMTLNSKTVKVVDACVEKYNEIMNPETAWHAYCVETDANSLSNLDKIIKPLYGNDKTCDNFTSDEYNAIMGGASAYCLLLAQDLSANTLDITSGIGAKLGAKLTADSGQQTVSALKGQSLTTVLNNKFNGNKTFVKACEEKYNEIMAGDKGDAGEDAATIWCKAHTVASGLNTTALTVKKMSAAKLVTAFKAAGNSDTKLSKSQDVSTGAVDGYFTDLQTCIDAVNADPTLMGGESAAETQYNEDVKKEKTESGTTFTLGTGTVTTFENKKNTFGSKMVTTDNIGSKIADNLPNTVMKTTDIDNANSATGLALKNAGFTKTSDLADLGLVTVTGTGANQSVKSDVVTKNNLATELTSNSAQTALANAGFATKSNITNEVKSDVFTLSDFSRLLSSGGLEVDNQGKLKLANTTTNAAAANINAKLTAAKANDASIQTTGLTATSNITTTIAGVAASAAGNEIKDQATCNKYEWMYWSSSAKCEKCPSGTYFNEASMQDTSLSRCICKDEALTFNNNGTCTKASMTSDKCSGINGAGMYFSTKSNTCEKCPTGTYFNEDSMENSSLPRCICEDKSLEFNASSGTCTAASSCAATQTVANPKNGGKCQECPKDFPFSAEINSCTCPAGTAFNAYRWGCVACGAAEAEYNPETQSCVCPQNTHMDTEQWKCTK